MHEEESKVSIDDDNDTNGETLDFLFDFTRKFETLRISFNDPSLTLPAKFRLYQDLERNMKVYTITRNAQIERDPSTEEAI